MRLIDVPVWEAAKPHLDVRSNDEHTLYSYALAQRLLAYYPQGDADTVLPAILLHDTGWKRIPADKILQAFGPDNKYPELTRLHEVEGVSIAEEALAKLGFDAARIAAITALIDGHDTTKNARSFDDALLKDADKLWRYTPHGVATIQGWFAWPQEKVLDVLENYVLPGILTDFGRHTAQTLLDVAKTGFLIKI